MATQTKAWVCGHSLAGIAGSNPAGDTGYLSLVSLVCCQVEVSASGLSLVQRSPTGCGVFESDLEASIMKRPWPTRGCCVMGRGVNSALSWKQWGVPRKSGRSA